MNVHRFLERSAQLRSNKTALICGVERLSFSEINQKADLLARYLMENGLQRQDRVVIFLENSAEAVISLFAVLKAGGVFVLLNPGMKESKLRYILNDCQAHGIITQASRLKIITDVLPHCPALQHMVCFQSASRNESDKLATLRSHGLLATVCDGEQAMARGARSSVQKLASVIDVDLAAIIYTSGSTGEPKGVVSTHGNMIAAANSIITYLENTDDDIVLNTLPLSFDYGLYQVLMTFHFGGTLVLEKSFTYPFQTMQKLVAEKVTGFPLVPTMAAMLLQIDLGRFDCRSLRYLTNTGAALPVAHIRKLQELFPASRIFSMYGLTECKRVSYLPPEQLDIRPDSVGVAMPNTEVLIVDSLGKEVGPNQIGELVVRGAHVMQGYWNAPEETNRTFRQGRYREEALLYTGDLFRKDEEGFLYFVARKDDLIKTRGERVSPREIENTLCSMEEVAEAAVVGVPDDILGYAIMAFVVPRSGFPLTGVMVQAYCNKMLESFMVPKYVEIRSSLPKSPTGKIDKKSLFDASK